MFFHYFPILPTSQNWSLNRKLEFVVSNVRTPSLAVWTPLGFCNLMPYLSKHTITLFEHAKNLTLLGTLVQMGYTARPDTP